MILSNEPRRRYSQVVYVPSLINDHQFKRREDEDFYPADQYATITGTENWTLPFGNDFRGGEAIIYYRTGESGTEKEFDFSIKGTNPTVAQVIEHVEELAVDDHTAFEYYPAILYHECGARTRTLDVMLQFNSPGKFLHSSMPNYGYPDGWGMAQIDLSGGVSDPVYYQLEPQFLWHWRQNVERGVEVFRQKIAVHDDYIDSLSNVYGASFCDPYYFPESVSELALLVNQSGFGKWRLTLVHSDIIKRYNGHYGEHKIKPGISGFYVWKYEPTCKINISPSPPCEEPECTSESLLSKWRFYGDKVYIEQVMDTYDKLGSN